MAELKKRKKVVGRDQVIRVFLSKGGLVNYSNTMSHFQQTKTQFQKAEIQFFFGSSA